MGEGTVVELTLEETVAVRQALDNVAVAGVGSMQKIIRLAEKLEVAIRKAQAVPAP